MDQRNDFMASPILYLLLLTFTVKSFLVTWKLTHLSRSQILSGEVCAQQAVPVTNELFKKKKTSKQQHLLIIMF